MWGNTVFNEGEHVHNDDGNLQTLTAEEAMMLSSPLQVAIPLDVAEEQHMQHIVVYLHEQFKEAASAMSQIRQRYEQQLAEQEQNTPGDSVSDYMYNVLNELDQPEEPPPLEMDLSEFSEEEQMMIRQSYKKNGNTLQ